MNYKLVPTEPSDEMIVAFAEAWYSKRQCIDDPDMLDAYRDMLAVAPTGELEIVGYQVRMKTNLVDSEWRPWGPCPKEIYDAFLGHREPNKFGIIREVRALYAMRGEP